MTRWSITRVAVAAALMAAVPAFAQSAEEQDRTAKSGQAADGGFASRDAVAPDARSASAPETEDNSGATWRSDPQPSADSAIAEPESLDADPQQAPGTINSFAQPEATPGFQATTGIDNRNQAVSSCLAAVRARVSGGAGAARVDGIRGEWMVSGAVDDGRAFYCAIHGGAISDVEFGG